VRAHFTWEKVTRSIAGLYEDVMAEAAASQRSRMAVAA
jgi:hypothetical protein